MSPTDITLLGSTGALGRRVLGVLLGAPDRFRVVGLAAGTQGDRLEAQADRCEARFGARPRGGLGEAALRDLAAAPAAGRVVCCVSGLAAWPALRAAAESGHDVVASSKECLALTGPWLRTRLAETGGRLRVLDSELTAAQWLMDTPGDAARARLILPASGGPFRGRERASLTSVTPEEAWPTRSGPWARRSPWTRPPW